MYLRLAKRSDAILLAACFSILLLAVYTQPYALFVVPPHILWSALRQQRRCAVRGFLALVAAAVAFLPWYVWSGSRWVSGISSTGLHFSFSEKTPLVLFREITGGGYWVSGLIAGLLVLAVLRRRLTWQTDAFLATLILLPIVFGLAADGVFDYFIAARQFIFVLPAVALFAAFAIERTGRLGQSLGIILEPGLLHGDCKGKRIVLAISPYCTDAQRNGAVTELTSRGYHRESDAVVGKSGILVFSR